MLAGHLVVPQLLGDLGPVAAEVEVLGLGRGHVAAALRIDRVEAHASGARSRSAGPAGPRQAADIGDLAQRAAQAVFFQADHVGQVLELVDHAQVLQERFDLRQRDAGHRRFLARARLHRDAVQVGQRDHVAGIDQVRVLDLRVGLPDLRPQPRALEERAGDIPQRVATLHRVGVRMAALHFCGDADGGDGQERSGQNRADRFKHGGHVPDSPCQFSPQARAL